MLAGEPVVYRCYCGFVEFCGTHCELMVITSARLFPGQVKVEGGEKANDPLYPRQ